MDFAKFLGTLGSLLSILTYMPQVVKLWRTKSAGDISMPMLSLLTFGVAVWFVYALLVPDLSLIITNAAILSMSLVMIILKIIYDKRAKVQGLKQNL